MNLINNYSLASENELASILSHYDSEFVLSVVDNAINTCCNCPSRGSVANVVKMWEFNFKALADEYGEQPEELARVRIDTFKEIIERICQAYKLNFTIDEDTDVYTAAYKLYDFFISNFASNVISFFANYIYNNSKDLYSVIGFDNKKPKDNSTDYAKRIAGNENDELAALVTNIIPTIKNIMGMDISFEQVLQTIYQNDMETVYYLSSIVSPMDGDFFSRFSSCLRNDTIAPMMLTMIRITLQQICGGLNTSNSIANIIVKK